MTEPVPAGTAGAVVPGEPALARSMALVTGLTALSRATGLLRIIVIATVVGYGLLGNVYQTANAVPNVIFELAVAGVIQAVLIPTLVVRFDQRDRAGAEHLAGAVLGLTTVVLGAAAVAAAIAAPWLAGAFFSGTSDPASRAEQVRLGTILLWCFLPQVVCYGAGLVATSVLNAQHRFAAATAAPIANNIVVIAACGAFWWLRDGAAPSLDLTTGELLVLGLGTTLGVVAFTGLPVLAARRTGFRLVPNLDHRDREVRVLARRGAWSGLFLASTQLLLVTVLILGNRVSGGVIAYQVGFQFFLVPYALFALPVLTTMFPRLSRHHAAGDDGAFGAGVGTGVGTIAYLVVPCAALLGALAPLIGRTFVFGQTSASGAPLVSDALVGFAPGLIGYALYLFASRVSYARGDTRVPALVNVGVVALGSLAMIVAVSVVPDDDVVLALAAAHSLAYLAGAAALLRRVTVPLAPADRPAMGRPIGIPLACGAAIGLGAALAAAGVAALGGPSPATFASALRGASR